MNKEPELVPEEFDEEVLAAEDHAEGHCVGCCDTAFHVVTSEEEFQALLRGLNSEGGF